MCFKRNAMQVTLAHFKVYIHSLIHVTFFELPLCENHQSMVPGTVWDSEMNATLQFLNEFTLIRADGKQL